MAFCLFCAALCFYPFSVNGQNSPDDLPDTEKLTSDLEQLKQNLEELRTKKIRINTADAEEFRQLPWLNGAEILAIIDRRESKAPFVSLWELEEILGKEKAAAIAPYIAFDDMQLQRKADRGIGGDALSGSFSSRMLWDTTPRDGLSDGRYPGDNYKLYNRFQLEYPHYRFSLVHDKDIGEPDVADFVSLSFSASDLGILKTAVFGNYELNFGEGLLLGQSRFLSKGSDPSNSVRLGSKRVASYGSSSEYGFFQGVAATLDLHPLEVTAFYSDNLVDARINKYGIITSFDEAGYHRTMTERKRKDNVTETVCGASVLYRFSSGAVSGKAGGTWLYYDYGKPLDVLGGENGSSVLGSFEADLSIGKLGLFGEAAWSENPGGRASWIAGLEYPVLQKVNLQIAVRDYDKGYYYPFAGAFAERGEDASNEQGVYIGLDAAVSRKFSLGAYYDQFTFPELSSTYPHPSSGYDTRLFLVWKPFRALTWNLQFQHKEKEDVLKQCANGSVSCKSKEKVYAPVPMVTDRFRLDCDIDLSRRFHLKTRGEVKRVVEDYLSGDEYYYGWMAYQQVNWTAGKMALKGRFTMFRTDDYDAAIYAYEDDLPFVFNTTAFNGRGKAFFLVASWDVTRYLKLAGKFETTWYDDRKVYSSGDDERDTSAPGSFHLGCFLKF